MKEEEKISFWRLFVDAVKGKEQDYTGGSIKKALILLSIPMILEMLMEALFALVDAFYVAQISNNALATIGLTESILMLLESIAIGIAMGATALIARRIGEKDDKKATESAMQALLLAVCVSVVTGILAFHYAPDILRLMGGEEELVQEGQKYARIILSLNIILMLLFVFNGIFRAAGNPAIAMRTLWLSNGLNIILDPIFIFGLGPITGMGLTGAAVATCIGRGAGVCYQIYMMRSESSRIDLIPSYLKPNWEILKRLIRVSAGGAGQFLISTASWIFLVRILASFGTDVVAGYSLAFRIIVFTILPSWGLANATATLVGQNLGAGHPDRAEQTVWIAGRYNFYFLVCISIIFFLMADVFVALFTDEVIVQQEASLCLRVIFLGYVFFAYQMIVMQSFNGAGDTYTSSLLSYYFLWLVQIPLAYELAITYDWGPLGVYTSICVAGLLMTLTAIYLFRKGKWKEVKV